MSGAVAQGNNTPLIGIIVGAGHFAEIQMEAWASVKGARIAAVVSLTVENARQLADRYDIPGYGDWETALAEVRPDFIDVCTPPDSHFRYVKLAADAGLPVLCQKPLAPTEEEGAALVRYCADRGVPLMINENWRWQAWYREMKRMIEAGMLGTVYTAYFAMRPGDGWGAEPYPVQPYFRQMRNFLLYETGVHWIDTFRFLFGEIESLYCRTRRVNPIIAGEDLAVVHFNFHSGVVAIYDANRTTYMEQVRTPAYGIMTLEGTEGKLRLTDEGRIFYTPREGTEQEHRYSISSGWKGGSAIATQQHFIDVLLGRTAAFESAGEAYLRTVRAVFACYESAERNQVVTL